ncbi:tRNA(Ile)-lysidine synthetase, N-terminal domain protein [Rubidibacter lacunae KORDI 51-2]|uniref:tRNA(Ile)-lysidine synthase n=1 Tax=Rubidibacter lacunae KORDI 51-2 TaxID=582515 RepID=U5DHQ1_9CHRO|nr:tRNA lysidine(34) synthetase TilS [Rubidibacter lacunae]ERN41166.1 tRNA(Ile)-lysidine synthetase, N-terminal domain protein [Rubidibacter lacunae KORDI 51-2]
MRDESRDWTPLHARVHQELRRRQLLVRGARVLLAVSGGQDSICLLKLCRDLQPKWNWTLAIAHCDHRWPTDPGIATHVERVAREFGLPFWLIVADRVEETEAAARAWRYRVLGDLARERGFAALATGHTASDRAETLLYNFMRGAGADGLQALVWQRPLVPNVRLVRPLLTATRTEIKAFCQEFQLPVWEDATNRELRFARARIRHELLPYLSEHFNPQVESVLAQTAEVLRADVDYLEAQAADIANAAIAPEGLRRSRLRGEPLALQRRVVRQWLQTELARAPTFAQIDAVVSAINAPQRTRSSTMATNYGRAWAEVAGDWICWRTE